MGLCEEASSCCFPLFILAHLVLSVGLSCATDQSMIRSEEEVKWMFEEWLLKHDRSYPDSGEKQRRLDVFRDNLRFIDEHNRPENNHTFTVGLNSLADLSNEEYRAMFISKNGVHFNISRKFREPDDLDLATDEEYQQQPQSIDWRDFGLVTPVKNQGICQSCWAFTAAATVEAVNAMVTSRLVSLSAQEIVDCDDLGDHCNPGYIEDAYRYIIRNRGISSEADYPYTGQQGTCNPNRRRVATIDGYGSVQGNSERALMMRVAKQPVGSAVDAAAKCFQFYEEGIFDCYCTKDVNHAVTIVGYGSECGHDYWIIKNTYGQRWGEGGYMRLRRNTGNPEGKCGIAVQPVFPVKSGAPTLTTH